MVQCVHIFLGEIYEGFSHVVYCFPEALVPSDFVIYLFA